MSVILLDNEDILSLQEKKKDKQMIKLKQNP